jgi:CubicO group peptidase (beta-lactamase class C family)
MDHGTGREVNGDTVFEIGSITKTFTALLLQDMIERGEMKLDDPVAKYLPKSVGIPTRNGKDITLLHLVTHTSGLPHEPDNLDPKRADNPRADYTVEKLYTFLSGYKLTRDPGAEFEYSSLGFGLLGHVIALKAQTNYESLVVDRICRPLKMDSTEITLTPELKARLAQGYNELGYAVPGWDYLVLSGCGALRSTVNDQLKYVAVNLGLTPSNLTARMERTHAVHFRHSMISGVGLGWFIKQAQGIRVVCHDGGTGGYSSFVGFDKTRRRGVVVLSNFLDDVGDFGLLLLESEWQPDRRHAFSYKQTSEQLPKSPEPPKPRVAIKLDPKLLDACVGHYEFAPNAVFPPSGMKVKIWREEEQLEWQAWGRDAVQGAIDIYPESETNFFLKINGAQLTFMKNGKGEITAVTHHMSGLPDIVGKKLSKPPN